MFSGNFAPRGWALCDGQLLSINENQSLFAILGTTYGGDGRTTFGLPDLRGRVVMHAGNGSGRTARQTGNTGGTETNTLHIDQLPSHRHSTSATVQPQAASSRADETSPKGNFPAMTREGRYTATPNASMGGSPLDIVLGATGGNQAINNIQPFQCVNYIIAIVGTFPSSS